MDQQSAEYFDRVRLQYFPQNINFISAHITLFHHLPGEHKATIQEHLAELCRNHYPVDMAVTGLRFLGRGVAYWLASPTLSKVRNQLAEQWSSWLTPQDRQRFQPHITVQNKVQPDEAKATLALLTAAARPQTICGVGLELWQYQGGPWEHVVSFPFSRQ